MNPNLSLWLHALTTIALQSALVVALIVAAQPLLRSARSKRAAWLAGFLGLTAVLVNGLVGFDRQLVELIKPRFAQKPQFVVRGNLPVTAASGVEATRFEASGLVTSAELADETQPPAPLRWLTWLWLAGGMTIGLRIAAGRVWLHFGWQRQTAQPDPATYQRVTELAAQLGLSGSVRFVESNALVGPIAFGWLRPTIGLPSGFWTAHSRAERDAMLAHELAHLAARDPLWLAFADIVAAVFWWHPLVWWSRRQLREASELAADEASLLVENGPVALADCLVSLAKVLGNRRVNGAPGMAGFRSGLGRRVERLLVLAGDRFTHQPTSRPLLALLAATIPAAVGLCGATALGWSRATEGAPTFLALAQRALTPPPTRQNTPSPASVDPQTAWQARLTMQLPETAAADRPSQPRLAMDALTRRLYATRLFSSVRCQAVGADRIEVSLRMTDTNSLVNITPSIGAPGRIEFRRVHPDSEILLQQATQPAGFEVLREPAGRGSASPRSYVVELTPAQGLTNGHLAEVSVITNAPDAVPVVSVRFTEDGARRFHELTRDAVGRQLAVVVDGEVLMAPRINAAIPGGSCQITGRFSAAEAGLLAAMLQTPLPAPLRVVDVQLSSEPTPTVSPEASGGVVPARTPSGGVTTLVQDGKLLYELGKTTEAKAKFEAALKQVPDDATAQHYLRLIREAGFTKTPQSQSGQGAQATPQPLQPTKAPGPVKVGESSTNQLYTRSFRVSTAALSENLQRISGQANGGMTNLPPATILRRLFAATGVDFAELRPDGPFPGSQDKTMFFNDRTGVLLVRANLTDLDGIETVLNTLNVMPEQVMIEAKFVEVTQGDTKALGFDWFLGNQTMAGITNAAGSNGGPTTITGIMTDPQFHVVVSALKDGETNSSHELRGDEFDWLGRQATNAHEVRVNAALGTTLTGILTDPQFRAVLRALEQRSGVDVLSAPRVTTLSDRQAQIQVSDIRSIVTGIHPDAVVRPGVPPGTNASPFTITQIPVGPVLDVIPSVGADGYTIELTIIASVNEFLGYDPPPKNSRVRVWQDGKARWVDTPFPRFRLRQVQTKAAVWDGQTLVLGAIPVEVEVRTQDKVPVLGDIPVVGGLFRSESRSTVRKQLLVFVTATIIDPAGNRVHREERLPYDPAKVPPQPPPLK